METGERLSAYLAGELDADDAAALEAQLVGDPGLRAHLERIRRANDALASLPEVAPSDAFSASLREAVADAVTAQGTTPVVDELAARRLQRRAGVSRSLGLGVAAAAVLVVGAIGLSQVLGGADDGDGGTVAMEAGPAADAVDPLAAYVRVTDTDHDADSVQALAADATITDLPAQVDDQAARDLEESRYGAFGLGWSGDAAAESGTTALAPPAPAAAGDTATGGSSGGSTGGGDGMGTGPENDAAIDELQHARAGASDPFQDVRRCLPEIVATASEPVIPLYAEVAAFEGEPAIIYLVLTREPGARLFNRVEVWVVSRADCFPLLFQQVQR